MKVALAHPQPHVQAAMARTPMPSSPKTRGFARVLIALIRLYQRVLSPLIALSAGRLCRFEPSCSQYAVACLESHGAGRGSLLSVRRLCKCHPFHPGGHDPPPGAETRL